MAIRSRMKYLCTIPSKPKYFFYSKRSIDWQRDTFLTIESFNMHIMQPPLHLDHLDIQYPFPWNPRKLNNLESETNYSYSYFWIVALFITVLGRYIVFVSGFASRDLFQRLWLINWIGCKPSVWWAVPPATHISDPRNKSSINYHRSIDLNLVHKYFQQNYDCAGFIFPLCLAYCWWSNFWIFKFFQHILDCNNWKLSYFR